MRKASLVVHPLYGQNKIFDKNDTFLNRDNCLSPFRELKEIFTSNGIDLNTNDITSPSEADFVIYNEMPKSLPGLEMVNKSFLILLENKAIRPRDWSNKKHRHFKKIFTWSDDYVDGKKYIKLNFAQDLLTPPPRSFKNKKLCAIICGNKASNYKNELYSKRFEILKWFETHKPNELDLYGMGWEKRIFSGPFRHLNRINVLRTFLYQGPPASYKGPVKIKLDVLSQYKFSICFENIRNESGYITEKLFDCFFAGCVPIYWGSPNVLEYVPAGCFIDFTSFKSFQEMYDFISNMNETTYFSYLNAAESYLNSELSRPFSSKYFAKVIFNEIVAHG